MSRGAGEVVGRTSAVRSGRLAMIVAALALASGVAGCSRPWMPVATQEDAARAQARWPSTTVEDLNQGRHLVMRRCGNCHQPPSPADRLAAEWPHEVDEMAERSGLHAGEAELVTRYLVAFARDQVARR